MNANSSDRSSQSADRAPGGEPVAWRRWENDMWVYYETHAWPDAEPLYTSTPTSTSAPEVAAPARTCEQGCNGCDECTDYDDIPKEPASASKEAAPAGEPLQALFLDAIQWGRSYGQSRNVTDELIQEVAAGFAEKAPTSPAPAPTEPPAAPTCPHDCTTHCLARTHGCGSECPMLPLRPPFSVEPPAAQAASEPGFGITAERLGQLLKGSLKPEEIGGTPEVQHKRVQELVNWFARFTQGNANPKWATQHACELAYYIASEGTNRAIDIEAVEKKAYLQGVNIPANERSMLERLGLAAASEPRAPVLTGWKLVPTEPTEKMVDAFENKMEGCNFYVRNFPKAYEAMLAAAPTATKGAT